MNRKVLRFGLFSQVIYCGGYSGEDPPLPIPNREVKLTIADGTDPPVGRVGSRRSSSPRLSNDSRGLFLFSLRSNGTAATFTPRASRCPRGGLMKGLRPLKHPRSGFALRNLVHLSKVKLLLLSTIASHGCTVRCTRLLSSRCYSIV